MSVGSGVDVVLSEVAEGFSRVRIELPHGSFPSPVCIISLHIPQIICYAEYPYFGGLSILHWVGYESADQLIDVGGITTHGA